MVSSSGQLRGVSLQASSLRPAFSILPIQLARQCCAGRQMCAASSLCLMDNVHSKNGDVPVYADWDTAILGMPPRRRFSTSFVHSTCRAPIPMHGAQQWIPRQVLSTACASARYTVGGDGGRPRSGGNEMSSRWDDGDTAYGVVGPTMSAAMSDTGGTCSFLQCVECGAVYAVESEELDGEPRLVRCCTCLHEWYACEGDLLWGDREAAAAIESRPSDRSGGAAVARRTLGKSVGSTEETIEADDVDEVVEEDSSNAEYEETLRSDSQNKPSPLFSERGRQARGSQKSVYDRSYEGIPFSGNPDDSFASVRTYSSKTDISVEINNVTSSSTTSLSRSQSPSDADPPQLSYNIFAGNLSFRATEEDLYRAFSGYGIVTRCHIPKDEMGGSRGYGFVEMSGEVDGEKAMDALQGASILGRDICLSKAHRRGNEYDQAQEHRNRYEKTRSGSNEFKDRSLKWENRERGGRSNSARKDGWSARTSHSSSYREYSVWSSATESKDKSVRSSTPRSDTGSADPLTPREDDQLSALFKANMGRSRNRDGNYPRGTSDWNSRGTRGAGRGRRPRGPVTDQQKRKR
jgi:predicted Zn finger-like uncharacterized protein